MAVLSLGLLAAASPSTAASRPRAAAKCARQLIGGKRVCLRTGQRCRAANRSDYLLFGFDCVRRRGRRVLAKASLATLRGPHVFLYDSRGLPSFPDALQAFDEQIAPLPGVRHRPGAVGVGQSGTPVIRALLHYRSRLTRAQRAVLDRVTAPHATSAAALPNSGEFVALRDEALRRLRAHGLRFTHAIGLGYDPNPRPKGELAYTNPLWLSGQGNYCQITIKPAGLGGTLEDREASMVHEVIHCAQGEALNTEKQWEDIPDWIAEGTANWGAAQVTSEWSRVPGYLVDWWRQWLDKPEGDLFKRDYDALGFFALIQHEGADPFGLIQPLSAEGGQGSPLAAFGGLLSAHPSVALAWGPTLATQPALGQHWDLAGPGDPRRDPPVATIANGSSWDHVVSARGGYAARLDLNAEIVRLDLSDPGIQGRLRTPDGNDHVLRSAVYTTVKGDLDCPDGTKLNYPKVPPGRAYLGFADMQRPATVGIDGLTVENVCEKLGRKPKPPKNDACRVLADADVAGIVGSFGSFQFVVSQPLPHGAHFWGCIFIGEKRDPEDPKRTVPTGLAGSLNLSAYPRTQQSLLLRRLGEFLNKGGYQRIHIAGADLAGIIRGPGGASIQMLVGRNIAQVGGGRGESDTHRLAAQVAGVLR